VATPARGVIIRFVTRSYRAAVLERPAAIETAPLRDTDRETGEPGPADLLVRAGACAVCRTDLQICEGDLPPVTVPIVPGHQAVGRVEAVGSGVSGWSVGDRAGIGWLASSCDQCEFCERGLENLCPNATFTGWHRDGGYAGYLTVRADFAFHIPTGFDDQAAAPLLCGGVIGYRSLLLSGVQKGERLGLYGFGASASITIQVARHLGIEVFVVTRSPVERERALRLGATWAGGYDEDTPPALHGAVTFAPVGEVVIKALSALRPGGTVAINAIHLDGIPAFDYDLLWRERVLRSVANYTRADARALLALAAEIPIRTEVELFPLDAANEALTRLKNGQTKGTAVLEPRFQ
jgi:propanol-preferring alcohol dehydrogenase